MLRITTISLLLLPALVHAQAGKGFNTEAVIRQMRAANVFESYSVGFAGKVSDQYLLFEKLVDSANTADLLRIIKTERNHVARLYELKALQLKKRSKKDAAVLQLILKQLLADTTRIATLTGCIGDKVKVSTLAAAEYPVYKEKTTVKRR